MQRIQQVQIRPRYQVVPITRTVRVNTAYPVQELDAKGQPRRRWVFRPENHECRGFMVYFPRGHSIFVESALRLRELGFDASPDMVNMDTGDVVEVGNIMDLRTAGEAALNSTQPVSVHDTDMDEDISSVVSEDLLGPPEQKTRPVITGDVDTTEKLQ